MAGVFESPLEQAAIQPQSTLLVPVAIDLPWYGLNLSVSASITHEPQLVIAEDTIEAQTISVAVSRLVITLWDRLILAAIILLSLGVVVRKRKK
jgi:hypothetical protein